MMGEHRGSKLEMGERSGRDLDLADGREGEPMPDDGDVSFYTEVNRTMGQDFGRAEDDLGGRLENARQRKARIDME